MQINNVFALHVVQHGKFKKKKKMREENEEEEEEVAKV